MGKFQLRKPRIISKNFPEVGSHIDNVSKSLQDVVFSYSEKVDKALQKKHMMMALSTLVLILVVGSFISPHGKADIATFYPETCLGGWLNPRNGEKEPETTSNADPTQFNDKNSAILDKNTSADIYCGNFTGAFNDATTPKKVIVSFAMTNKGEITIGETSTSSLGSVTDIASTTPLDASSTETLLLASSTDATSTVSVSSSTLITDTEVGSSTVVLDGATTTETAASFVGLIVDAVTETISDIFNASVPSGADTDTVIVPQPVPTESVPTTTSEPVPQAADEAPPVTPSEEGAGSIEPSPTSPTSYLDIFFQRLVPIFTTTVFAQEVPSVTSESSPQVEPVTSEAPTEEIPENSEVQPAAEVTPPEVIAEEETAETPAVVEENVATTSEPVLFSSTSTTFASSTATTTDDLFSASSTASSTALDITTSSSTVVEEAEDTQNNFLEIFYTFDGVTWISLGELNEISMKYRTFEIPLSASTTWSDMSQLQIKVTTKSLERETPVTYLDGIRVEVLYDSTLEYSHPDFVRDTILKDETIDGVRLVTIINNETNEEEVWYMYLDEEITEDALTTSATSTIASSTTLLENATTSTSTTTPEVILPLTATTTEVEMASSSMATSTDMATSTTASTTPKITPVIPKNKWFKLEKKEVWVELSPRELVEEIKKVDKEKLAEREDEEKEKEKEDRLPDFAKDILRKIKGTLLNAVIIQVEKEGKEELWLYDLESGDQNKIEAGSSTAVTIAKDMQLGLKDSHIFWLSEDRTKVYAYDLLSKSVVFAEVPPFDPSLGQRARVVFDGIPWEVVIGPEEFAFYSEATGEVFSDDNGNLTEALRQKLELDKILDVEAISDLNFSVTATGTAEE